MIRQRKLMPWLYITLGLLVIFLGSVALYWSQNQLSWVSSIYYSVSACCITGLSLDKLNELNWAGQFIMLLLIQTGGIGVMTMIAAIIEFLGGGLSRTQSSAYDNNLMLRSLSMQTRIGSIFNWVTQYSLLCEGLGGIIILLGNLRDVFHNPVLYPGNLIECLFKAVWNTIFLSISSFCNAGASPFPDSLEHCSLLTQTGCALLVIAGGFGIYVIADLRLFLQSRWQAFRNQSQENQPLLLTLHTKVVLHATWLFLILGAVSIFVCGLFNLEKPLKNEDKTQVIQTAIANPAATVDNAAKNSVNPRENRFVRLSGKKCAELARQAVFYSVFSRTAGFSATPLEELNIWQFAIITILMFIGGAPGSTAGGIKITTAVLIFFAFRGTLRGQERTVIAHRSIPANLVLRAFVMVGLFLAVILLGLLAVSCCPGNDLSTGANLFRVISAVTTAGYSCNTAGEQCAESVIFMILMIMGRLGPHAVIFFLLGREKRSPRVKFPEDKLILS